MDDFLVVGVVVVVVNVAWTLLVRTVPAVLTATLTKSIEHQYATSLSRLKADWDARYSTLKSSVDFLSASQSDLRARSITSVESLWTTVLEIECDCRDLVTVDRILTPKEIQDFFVSGRIKTFLGDYRDFEVVAKKVERFNQLTSERERLFSGERLWLRFSTFCQAHGRMAMLAQFSFEKGTYVDWRTDDHMNKILSAILPPDVLKRTTMMKAGGVPGDHRPPQGGVPQGGYPRHVRLATRRGFTVRSTVHVAVRTAEVDARWTSAGRDVKARIGLGDDAARRLMASGARSPMHLDALDAAVAAYGRCADPSTAMAPSEWQRFPASGGERADAMRSGTDFPGPVDSRSKWGNRRGKQDHRADSKLRCMNELRAFCS